MSIELPKSGDVFLPQVPPSVKDDSRELFDFLQRMKRQVEDLSRGQFNNALVLADAINSGTSGTFTISSGGSIVVTSGIVITVTS